MPLPTAEERSHCGRVYARAITSVRFGPKQRDRVVWSVVIKHERQGAAAEAEPKIGHSANIGVPGPDDRIVI